MAQIMTDRIGWVAMSIACAACGHEWVLVAPFDIVAVICNMCGHEMSIASIVDTCPYCLRPFDNTVTGDAPCPLCDMPMIQDECYHA